MFLGIVGIFIVITGVFFVASSIDELIRGSDTEPGVLWGLLAFSGALTGAGALLAWNYLGWQMSFLIVPIFFVTILYFFLRNKNPKTKNWDKIDLENKILKVTESTNGQATVAMIALKCKISIEEARLALEELSIKGVAEPKVTENGDIVYIFAGLIAQKDINKIGLENKSQDGSGD